MVLINPTPTATGDFTAVGAIVSPSAGFTGTAGSGFGGAHPAAPSDPTRTTAKPACRLLVPDRQAFTKHMLVGVYAGANNAGSLMATMGLTSVIFHYEGGTRTVSKPSWAKLIDGNGKVRRYWGWWCWLKHNTVNGQARLYVEAVPRDGTMQRRVMGPYIFLPSATQHDYDLTVAPSQPVIEGQRYQTMLAAFNYLRGVSAQRPRVTITEAGSTYTLGQMASAYTGGAGRCLVQASVPVTFALTSGTKGAMRPRYSNLHFRGSNITFDMRYISELYLDEGDLATGGPAPVLEGVNFINSGGRDELWDKGRRTGAAIVRRLAWFLECNFSGTHNTVGNGTLVRGGTGTSLGTDFANGDTSVIGFTLNDLDSGNLRAEIPALRVQYSGAGTGTLSLSGGNDATTRTFTAKVAGSSVGTFAVVNNNPAGNYDVADVATWLNGLAGWSATTLDDTRRATALGRANTAGTAFTDVDVKTAPVDFVTMFDIHSDWYQNVGAVENVVLADNVGRNLIAQQLFVTVEARDMLVLNNVFHGSAGALLSQMSAPHRHVVVAHNSWADQNVTFRENLSYNADGYCLVANNAFKFAGHEATDPDLVTVNNHYMTGGAGLGSGTGATSGGSKSSLFVAADGGNFRPAGEMLTNLKAPVMRFDARRVARANPAPAGAFT
jgi:hypothetical protein